jgi:AcrR family transcriptional regulator
MGLTPRKAEGNQKIREEQRARLLQAATKVFSQRGYVAAKVSDVAAEARVSQGLVYLYFAGKAELFGEVVGSMMSGMEAAVADALTAPAPPEARLRRLCSSMLAAVRATPESWGLALEFAKGEGLPEQAQRAFIACGGRLLQEITSAFEAGQGAGVIVDGPPHELALFFMAIFQGLAASSAGLPEGARFVPNEGLVMRAFLVERPGC